MGKSNLGQRKGCTKAAKRRVKKQKGIKRYASHALGAGQGYLRVSPCAWSPKPKQDNKSNLLFPHESKLFPQSGE